MLVLTTKCIPPLDPMEQNFVQKLTSYYLDMIMKAWGIFYSRVEQNLENYNSYKQMNDDYENNFMKKLNEWIPKNCNSVYDAFFSIEAEKLKRIDWLQLLMNGLDIVECVVCLCFPASAPIVVIANVTLKGGVRIYKRLKAHEKINWFQEFLEIGINGALSLTGLKLVNKGVKTIAKKIVGQAVKWKKPLNFMNKIKKHVVNKNKGEKILKFIGRGFAKDIAKRREEYKSALADITKDLALGKDPSEKISKLIIDEVYNGCSSITIDYINKVMGDKKTLSKKTIEGAINTITFFLKGVTNDVINNKDLMTSIRHNRYKCLSNQFYQKVNEKFDGMQKVILDGVEKSIDSLVLDIIDNKKVLFNERGEFNLELIKDFYGEFKKNKEDAEKKFILKKLKDQINEELNKKNNK